MKKNSGLAVASLIMGILGLVIVWLPPINVIMLILAVVFGGAALSSIKKKPDQLGGRGLAIAGLVLGLVGLIPSVIIIAACGGFGILGGILGLSGA